MGDTIISTATLNALRKENPSCKIHFLGPATWLPILEGHQSVDRLIPWYNYKGPKKFFQFINIVQKVRSEKYDCVVALHAASTTANIARLSGAPVRSVHFHGMTDPNRFSTVSIPGKGLVKPIIERDIDAIRALGGIRNDAAKTSLKVTEEESSTAKNWLSAKHMKHPLLVLAPGASRPTKIWPLENFKALASEWVKRNGSVLLLVGPGEEYLQAPFSGMDGVVSRIGGPLRESMALIKEAKLFIGNDSGPKHMAVALGVKTITLFGPENPFEWHPYDRTLHKVLHIPELPCRTNGPNDSLKWCGIQSCVEEKHRCMTSISAQDVINEWND